MMQAMFAMVVLALGLWGCSTGDISRGGTLLYGLNQYQSDMQRVGSGPSNWPARQQVAGELKTVISGMLGATPEFQRLVELDLRKREFTITLRATNVRPERAKEIQDELVQIDDEIAALKPVIKTQLSAYRLNNQPDAIDAIATLGLLGIALDGFSAGATSRGGEAPSTKVGQHVVTDFGDFATVRAANGYMFRCSLFGNLDDGAGVRCEPGK
jgi:hypothetical protein